MATRTLPVVVPFVGVRRRSGERVLMKVVGCAAVEHRHETKQWKGGRKEYERGETLELERDY